MDFAITRLFFENWPRKLLALIGAIAIWLFVSSSITDTKTIPNVPIRITNLPPDKTIVGLLPNRLLSKRVTLTLSGSKAVIQELEAGDLEVLLDVSSAESDEWVVQITKKNLVSLNPSIDLFHHITLVEHPKFVLKLSPLMTAKIPIKIVNPIGDAPPGYEYLDVWPQTLIKTISGSEEEVKALSQNGMELVLNLSDITKEELDELVTPTLKDHLHDDEISFLVPEKWKKISVNGSVEDIDDPNAEYLHIDFLRKEISSIPKELPIRVFYPLKFSDTINANTYPLALNDLIYKKNGISLFAKTLFVRDVSRLFLDIISDNLELTIVAAPKKEKETLQWSLEVIDPQGLENVYVSTLLGNSQMGAQKEHEMTLRRRFQDYLRRLTLYDEKEKILNLDAVMREHAIDVILKDES